MKTRFLALIFILLTTTTCNDVIKVDSDRSVINGSLVNIIADSKEFYDFLVQGKRFARASVLEMLYAKTQQKQMGIFHVKRQILQKDSLSQSDILTLFKYPSTRPDIFVEHYNSLLNSISSLHARFPELNQLSNTDKENIIEDAYANLSAKFYNKKSSTKADPGSRTQSCHDDLIACKGTAASNYYKSLAICNSSMLIGLGVGFATGNVLVAAGSALFGIACTGAAGVVVMETFRSCQTTADACEATGTNSTNHEVIIDQNTLTIVEYYNQSFAPFVFVPDPAYVYLDYNNCNTCEYPY